MGRAWAQLGAEVGHVIIRDKVAVGPRHQCSINGTNIIRDPEQNRTVTAFGSGLYTDTMLARTMCSVSKTVSEDLYRYNASNDNV